MAIDIFNIEPNVITRDLSGKSFFIYGEKKSGKTSNAVKFKKSLLVATERGYDMLSGVTAQPIDSWAEILMVKRQLLQDAKAVEDKKKAETTFSTIIIDTADLAYNMCEKFILQKEGVEYLDETEMKRGYKATEREFDSFFQDICRAGYTLVAISHSTTVQFKDKGSGEKYDKIQPTIDKRGYNVLSRLVDVMAYSTYETDENGKNHAVLYMRGNKFLEAGSRNKYTSEKIPFTYEALLADMQQAIDKLEKNDGATVINTPTNVFKPQSEIPDFNTTVEAIKNIALSMKKENRGNEYKMVIEKILGKGKNVKDCDESQAELLGLVLVALNDYLEENPVQANVAEKSEETKETE